MHVTNTNITGKYFPRQRSINALSKTYIYLPFTYTSFFIYLFIYGLASHLVVKY